MSINAVKFTPVQKAATKTTNEAKYAGEQSFDNTPKETDGKKLTTALKCLGVAAAAGLAVYAGVKGVKYLKNKNAASAIKGLLEAKPQIKGLLEAPKPQIKGLLEATAKAKV